jgi:hypothetical protein
MLKPTPIQLNPEARRRQRLRNWAIFGLLVAFAVLIFIITIVKITGTGGT